MVLSNSNKEMQDKHKGRILRLKKGYNPNSSSVGSQIPYFMTFTLSSGIVSIIILNILNVYDRHIRKTKDDCGTKSTPNKKK